MTAARSQEKIIYRRLTKENSRYYSLFRPPLPWFSLTGGRGGDDSDYPTDSQVYCATGGKGAVFNTILAHFKRNWSYLFPSDNITLRVAIVPTQTTTFGAIWPQSGLTWKTIAWDYDQSRLSEQLQSHLEKTEINVKRNYSAPCFRTVRRMGLSNWRTLR